MASFCFHGAFHNRLQTGLLGAFLLLTSTTNVFSQTSVVKKIKEIDSIAAQIDSSKTFTIAVSEGSSEDEAGFSFSFHTYYKKELKMVFKAKYSSFSPTTSFKTFYYNNNKLVKILSDGNSYYYIQNTLYTANGNPADKTVSEELLDLSNMPLQDIEQYFKRMS